jgi:hypothetical protein
MEVIEFEIAPEIREEWSRSFSRGVSPLLAALPLAPLLLAVVELVGLGRMR